jgi:stage V sporulation protein G
MEITEVKVFPIQEEKLKAFVSIVFDQCFMVNDIKIIQGRDGLFISMPSRKKKNGEFKDVAHPLNNETRRMIEEKVLSEYDRVREERGEPPAERGERSLRAPSAGDVGDEEAHSLAAAPPPQEKSMEEVEEIHLSDSFWTV